MSTTLLRSYVLPLLNQEPITRKSRQWTMLHFKSPTVFCCAVTKKNYVVNIMSDVLQVHEAPVRNVVHTTL